MFMLDEAMTDLQVTALRLRDEALRHRRDCDHAAQSKSLIARSHKLLELSQRLLQLSDRLRHGIGEAAGPKMAGKDEPSVVVRREMDALHDNKDTEKGKR